MALIFAANYATLADSYGVGFTNVQYQQDGGTIQNNAAGIPGANHPLLGNSLYCSLAPNETRREATPPGGVNSFGEGEDVYFRFDFVLDSNFEINTTNWFHIISQIHSASSTASPVIEFDVRDGGLYIRGSSETQTSAYNTRLVTVTAGVKYSVIFRVRFSFTAASSLIQVWVDGTQVYNQVPPIAMLNAGGDSYWKGAGLYRASAFTSTEGCWQTAHGVGTTYADVAALAPVGDVLPPFPTGTDAYQTAVLGELAAWGDWLEANDAQGHVGEFGGVTLMGYYNQPSEQAKWDALANVYMDGTAALGLWTTPWAAGRTWGIGYPLGLIVGQNVGDPLDFAHQGWTNVYDNRPTSGTVRRGVNLSGWEEGVTINGGGTVRTTEGYRPSAGDYAALAGYGVDTVRLPIAWERIQMSQGAALDTISLSLLNTQLVRAAGENIKVIIDLHNYGRYTDQGGAVQVLGGGLTTANLVDFWTKLSTWVRADLARDATVVGYDLMNEPHALPGGAATWEAASQAVVTALRGNGDTRTLLIEGHSFSSLTEWATQHPDGWITDPAGNFRYSAHHYWDTTSALGSRSGTYQQSATGPILEYDDELNARAGVIEEPAQPPASGRPGRWNLSTNPALAVDATGWTQLPGTGVTGSASRVAVTGMDRPWAYQYAQTSTGGVFIAAPPVPVTPGKSYSLTAQVRYSGAATDGFVYCGFIDAGGALVGAGGFILDIFAGAGLALNVPIRMSGTGKAPANAVALVPRVYLTTTSTSGPGTVTATAVRVEQSDDPALTYADGDTAGWSWLGAAGASAARNPAATGVARLNQIINPALAQNATDWTSWQFGGVAAPTVQRVSVSGMTRPWAWRLVSTAVHNYASTSPAVPVTPGKPYGFSGEARFSFIPETTASYYIRWENADGSFHSSTAVTIRTSLTVDVPYTMQAIRYAPAGAARARFGVRWTATSPGGTVDLTAVRIEPGYDSVSITYADGSTGGWVWDGTSGSSTSRSVPAPNILPGTATSTESAPALSRKRVRAVGIADTELDTAAPVGLLRGGALIATITDTFEAGVLDPRWTATGATVTPTGRLAVTCAHTAGTPMFSNARSTMGYAWNGSSLTFEITRLPTVAGVDTAFAQMWVMDPSPAATVDRLGFEYRAQAFALDLLGQTGAGFAPIGTTTTLTYSATNHRWLRITHTGTSIVWATSADGLTWVTQRTLTSPPSWTTKTTLKVSFEAYRSTGTNDTFEVDAVNLPPLRIVRPVRGLSAVGRSFSF